MPVTTDTFRNTRVLNVIFAVSAVVLLGSILWLVFADYTRDWRTYQRQAIVWSVAMTEDAQRQAIDSEYQASLELLEQQIEQINQQLGEKKFAELGDQTLAQAEQEIQITQEQIEKLKLPTAVVKGQIGPLTQQLERAVLAQGEDSNRVKSLREELASVTARHDNQFGQIASLKATIGRLSSGIRLVTAKASELDKQLADLQRVRQSLKEKIDELNPQGPARLSKAFRDAPLLDWFNPTEKVQQVVAPAIRTDLNFLTVETIDRCNTCHINIGKPAFEQANLLLFVERQLASYQGQDTNSIQRPVVLLEFWQQAAEQAGPKAVAGLEKLDEQALAQINKLRGQAQLEPLASAKALEGEFARISQLQGNAGEAMGSGGSGGAVGLSEWYQPLAYYLEDLKKLLRGVLAEPSFDQLGDLYRFTLVQQFNEYRAQDGLPPVSADSVLLGHPNLDRYVDADSAHPMKTMGCTVCHEGSGQETDFTHATHTPREIWVDANTGAPVPEFLLAAGEEHGHSHEAIVEADKAHRVSAGVSLDGAAVALAVDPPVDHQEQHAAARYTHDDVKLTDPTNPAPFAPKHPQEAQSMAYHDPANPEQLGTVIRQGDYWAKKHHWHAVHFMHWERPMHRLDYVQSSCNKCHTEVFDIKDSADRLYEGRLLFSQMGCVNCHAVDSLNDDLDIKRVGPSLVHIKQKLSAPMIASWVWSPKAFRPTTKMPHYFMLENNSSPVDILRTRTEVAAITHYLLNSEPAKTATAYQPELPPSEHTGDPAAGKAIFNRVGCLACHTNMAQSGQQWIVEDLIERVGVTQAQAQQQFQAMDYNQQHWYALEHLQDKLERTGPELSGVGTKLKAGRTDEQARAWLYDWLRNPRHYNSYTIMPSFRLSEDEANDLAAYLLTLERPGYQPVDFLALDPTSQAMLAELVATLKAAQSTLEMARQEAQAMPQNDQLAFLGKKMIGHYGCSGCHAINGFETAVSACTNLDGWGIKDPHKLDFGYFDHAFDHERQTPNTVWKVAHEGLAADAPKITPTNQKVEPASVHWEHMDQERRPWLYHKLHNPRVYDRGRTAFEGRMPANGSFDIKDSAIGRPYDKLKMPKFFLTDQQVRALITFVTSIRPPLVGDAMQSAAADEAKLQLIRGRQIATRYNCYGCHNIEGNQPHIWEFFDVYRTDGSFNYENLSHTPPLLIGQGAKTQPDWLFEFLHDVQPLRPTLDIRMPSFPLTPRDATGLVEYFAGHSQVLSGQLNKYLEPINQYIEKHPEDADWFTRPAISGPVEQIKGFALTADLVRAKDLDPRQTTQSQQQATWAKLLSDVQFTAGLNQIEYPFSLGTPPRTDATTFARGQALFTELRCVQCHSLGDPEVLDQLWLLDNPAGDPTAEAKPLEDEEEYGYDDAADSEEDYGYDDTEEEDGYGDDDYGDDGYGDEGEESTVLTGPVFTAPNLSLAADRLQARWVDHWLQEPNTMQPGTKMPQWFAGGDSAFAKYPASLKGERHELYGYTGAEQRRYLIGFLYDAGRRNFTPGQERLSGIAPPAVELTALAAPLEPEPSATDEPIISSTGSESAPTQSPATTSESSPVVEPVAPPAVPPTDETVSHIDLHDEPTAAYGGQGNSRVVGVVRFGGKKPRRKPIRMGSDPYCDKHSGAKRVLNETMMVNGDQSMQNVLVYVKSGLTGDWPVPSDPVVINQEGCMYHPHVSAAMAGQAVKIINSDNTLHNVKVNPINNSSFNEGMPVKGMVLDKIFPTPEMKIPLKCDVHSWMTGYLHVLDNPFFCVSDVQGRYEIAGLPPGQYVLEAIHESSRVQPVTFEVVVEADTSYRTDVTLGQ